MIKFAIQAEAEESKRLRAALPEAVRPASPPSGTPVAKSKAAKARVARIKKPIKEVKGQ